MSTVRIDRFTVEPQNAEKLVRHRNDLVEAVRAAAPGLLDTRLVKVDERTWVDMWRWDSLASARAAAERARAGGFPEAGAVFALADDVTTEFTEVVDER